MSIHYKFKSAIDYDTITFDGLHISVSDLKKSIVQQKRLGKATDFDLMITNAQTNEVYTDESALIPKNTSLIVARVPIAGATNKKIWDRGEPSLIGTSATSSSKGVCTCGLPPFSVD